jgi:hypothetical protein
MYMGNAAHSWAPLRDKTFADRPVRFSEKMRPLSLLVASLFFTIVLSSFGAAQAGKAEMVGPVKGGSVSDAVAQSLQDKGYRLTLPDGGVIAELWFRKEVAGQAKKEIADALYTQLSESEFVGIVHFPDATTDFRGQPIPAGFYSLRYALMPNDGNHMGVAPNRDFLVLIPSAADPDPNATFKFAQLVSMSGKASGTKHPAALSLASPEGSTAAITKDDQDHYIFSAAMKLVGGDEFPIALIVKGIAQQ